MPLSELLSILHYDLYPEYYLETNVSRDPDIASLFRTAFRTGVHGIYVFQTSPEDKKILPVRPAVYIAEAQTVEDARELHRKLWNLGQVPFLIVVLPNQIRIYTGFDYSKTSDKVGQIDEDISLALDRHIIYERLADFSAESINTGNIWQKRANELKPDQRVDKHLLDRLSRLGGHLREKEHLRADVAHALIGKYVYIRYLRDRKILSDEWLRQNNIDLELVLGRQATVAGLRKLIEALEKQLNGHIFPLDFDQNMLEDKQVAFVASAFKGDKALSDGLTQLSLNFDVYDFEYIPVETLSSIYEQFMKVEGGSQEKGAFYTPEFLADYLLSEMNAVKPLKTGMKILDPSCGSGVFLVLAYRRLIEMKIAEMGRKLRLPELLKIVESFYGVERERDACYVAEFSLILTLLDYADPNELHKNKHFKFPSLHNTQIFECDFFDDNSLFWKQVLKFNWIVGNPPWIEIIPGNKNEEHILSWIAKHRVEYQITSNRAAEAFSWRVTDLLDANGITGLILPATSLFNHESKNYRQQFFKKHEVARVTNFSNLSNILFGRRAIAPAVTIIYHKASDKHKKLPIDHYGPFFINQIPSSTKDMWTITINENEIQTVSPSDAESGNATIWKTALWGNYRDKRSIERLSRFFPMRLGQLCKKNNWHLHEASQLRSCPDGNCDGLEYVPEIEGKKCIDIDLMNESSYLFSIPDQVLKENAKERYYVRLQGGKKGLRVFDAPHILIHASWKYVIYSDQPFIIPPRQIGLAAPEKDSDYLRAVSIFLSSSIIRYYLFFQTPSWGIERNRITLNDVKNLPVPDFTSQQIEKLADLQRKFATSDSPIVSSNMQEELDKQIAEILNIPESINISGNEFVRVRLMLNQGFVKWKEVVAPPSKADLLSYAQQLSEELNGFLRIEDIHHKVIIRRSKALIVCSVESVKSEHSIPPVIEEEDSIATNHLDKINDKLNQQFSQWVYIKRGLRVFSDSEIRIYKTPRLIDWTRTQALNDADDIISEALTVETNT